MTSADTLQSGPNTLVLRSPSLIESQPIFSPLAVEALQLRDHITRKDISLFDDKKVTRDEVALDHADGTSQAVRYKMKKPMVFRGENGEVTGRMSTGDEMVYAFDSQGKMTWIRLTSHEDPQKIYQFQVTDGQVAIAMFDRKTQTTNFGIKPEDLDTVIAGKITNFNRYLAGRVKFCKTRRRLVIGLGLAAVASVLPTFKLAPEIGAFSALEIMRRPNLFNAYLRKRADLYDSQVVKEKSDSQLIDIKNNPSFRNVYDQIAEAIHTYSLKGGKVTYKRKDGWKPDDYYLDTLEKDVGLAALSFDDNDELITRLMTSAMTLTFDNLEILAKPQDSSNFHEFVVPESGLYDMVCWSTGKCMNEYKDYRSLEGDDAKRVNLVVKDYFLGIKRLTEEEVSRNGGKPVSVSRILSILLEFNNGSLDKSIWDISLFLRYASRCDFVSGEFSPTVANDTWMAKNILDEYGKIINYADLPPGFNPNPETSRMNQTGKAYHAWAMVSKLQVIPSCHGKNCYDLSTG